MDAGQLELDIRAVGDALIHPNPLPEIATKLEAVRKNAEFKFDCEVKSFFTKSKGIVATCWLIEAYTGLDR